MGRGRGGDSRAAPVLPLSRGRSPLGSVSAAGPVLLSPFKTPGLPSWAHSARSVGSDTRTRETQDQTTCAGNDRYFKIYLFIFLVLTSLQDRRFDGLCLFNAPLGLLCCCHRDVNISGGFVTCGSVFFFSMCLGRHLVLKFGHFSLARLQ